jgi:hypothetical protein
MLSESNSPRTAPPVSRKGEAAPPGITPEEAAKLIGFALSELSTENAHHEFEHLCRHLTRRKICPNILPATGPVSAGGDQGADFETYKVADSEESQSAFFAKSIKDKWIFACSLQKNYKKKIKGDLQAATNFVEPVQRVVFFHNAPIPTSARHKLKQQAFEEFGLELEIFDSKALSEMLSDHGTVWKAQRYLSLPAELILLREDHPSPDWFQEVLYKNYGAERLTSAEFFELKDAVRYATRNAEHHSDLPKLLEHLRIFRLYRFEGIGRKAIYEEFVASLRGLETTIGLESSIRDYLAVIASLSDPAELEDSAVLLTYSLAAHARGILNFPIEELRQYHSQLTTRVAQLESEAANPTRRCMLLFVSGHLAFNSYLTVDRDPERAIDDLRASFEAAVKIWRRLMKQARNAPIFPIERIARLVNEFIVPLDGVSGIDQLIRSLDALSVERSGQLKLSEHHRQRAQTLTSNEKYLRALDELHKAHSASFSSGTTIESVQICLQLSKLYYDVGLYFAARYYGLAGCYAALKLPEQHLRQLAYVGCGKAASADHASGGSLMFFLTARLFAYIASEYAMGGTEERKLHELGCVQFYACVLARGAGLVFENLQGTIVEQMLPGIGLDDLYEESRLLLDDYFRSLDSAAKLAEKAISSGIAPPFSDVGGTRRAAWRQLGVDWHFEWKTSYETDRQAQALTAHLQILLAGFANTELSILPGEAFVRIEVHDGELEIEEVPDNKYVRRIIRLPLVMPQSAKGIPGYAFAVASTLIKAVSALKPDQFLKLHEAQFASGLMERLIVYSASESLFEEFYDRESYDLLYSVAALTAVRMPDHLCQTWHGLQGPQGIHPQYDRAESMRAVRLRYEKLIPLTRLSVRRLMQTEGFRQTLEALRREGWKDWHILTGIENVRFNYFLNQNLELRAAFERKDFARIAAVRSEPEREDVLLVRVSEFEIDRLKFGLQSSQVNTLEGLGLRVWQRTPDFGGIDQLLRRFCYWDDDVPHEEIFQLNA